MAIHFRKSLVDEATKMIKESQELLDVSHDLEKVFNQMEQVEYSTLVSMNDTNEQQRRLQQARELDKALRQKYPMIDDLLNAADKISKSLSSTTRPVNDYEPDEYRNLMQDYYGILCDTLIKKQITKTIEEFIEKVD